MSYTNTGTYLPISGSENAAPGQIIASATWNAIFTDMARSLQATMLQQLSFWAPHNILWMNGGFDIDQRLAGNTGTFNSGAIAYTLDRWYLYNPNNASMTVQQTPGLTNESHFAATVRRAFGNTGTGGPPFVVFGYPLDTDEIYRLRGASVSMSFTAQASANISNSTVAIQLFVGTGPVAKFVNNFTNSQNVAFISANLSGSVQTFNTASAIVIPANITQAEVLFSWNPLGTAGADDSFTVDNVELDVDGGGGNFIYGFELLPFSQRLAGCQRFYAKTFQYGTQPANSAGIVGAFNALLNTGQSPSWNWQYPVSPMRAQPVITTYNPFAANSNIQTAFGVVFPALQGGNSSSTQVLIYSLSASPAGAVGPFVHATADASI